MIIDVGRIASTVASSAGRAAEVVRHTAMTMAKTLSDPKVGVPVAITAVKGLTFISNVMPDVVAMLNKMADDMANFDPASVLGEFSWISFPRVELRQCNAFDVVCHFENGLRNLYNGFAVIGEGLANALYFIGYHFVYYLIKGLALLSSAVVRYVVVPVTNMAIMVGGLIKDALISFFCAYLRVAVPLLTSYRVVRGVLNGRFDMWSVVVGMLGTVAAYTFVPECGIIQMPGTVTINTSSKFDRLHRDSIRVSDSFTYVSLLKTYVFDDSVVVNED
ncbi:MAG: hypothetical protein QXT13_10210 [Pyrobaculum sp.]